MFRLPNLSKRRRDQRNFEYSTVVCTFICKDSSFSQLDKCPIETTENLHTPNSRFVIIKILHNKKYKNDPCYQTFFEFFHSKDQKTQNLEEAKKENIENIEEHEATSDQSKEQGLSRWLLTQKRR